MYVIRAHVICVPRSVNRVHVGCAQDLGYVCCAYSSSSVSVK